MLANKLASISDVFRRDLANKNHIYIVANIVTGTYYAVSM